MFVVCPNSVSSSDKQQPAMHDDATEVPFKCRRRGVCGWVIVVYMNLDRVVKQD